MSSLTPLSEEDSPRSEGLTPTSSVKINSKHFFLPVTPNPRQLPSDVAQNGLITPSTPTSSTPSISNSPNQTLTSKNFSKGHPRSLLPKNTPDDQLTESSKDSSQASRLAYEEDLYNILKNESTSKSQGSVRQTVIQRPHTTQQGENKHTLSTSETTQKFNKEPPTSPPTKTRAKVLSAPLTPTSTPLSPTSTGSLTSSPGTPFLPSPNISRMNESPASNLRGLVTLANVSMGSKGTRKNKKEEDKQVSTPSSVTSDDSNRSIDEENYKRKDKSLSLLCHNFLKTYGGDDPCEISLGDTTKALSVERRRIYDIIHVFESLGIMKRLGKNRYKWHGLSQLPEAISNLKKADSTPRREKSLGSLSHKFVMMFLQSETRTVTLEEASLMLSSFPSDDEQNPKKASKTKSSPKQKTKIRRLYDIANVLSSLELIKKVKVLHGSSFKSAFEWVGPLSNPKSNDNESSENYLEDSNDNQSIVSSSPAAPALNETRKRKSDSELEDHVGEKKMTKQKEQSNETSQSTPPLNGAREHDFFSPTKLKTVDNQEIILPAIPTVHESAETWEAYFNQLRDSLSQVCVNQGTESGVAGNTGLGLIQLTMASRAIESPRLPWHPSNPNPRDS